MTGCDTFKSGDFSQEVDCLSECVFYSEGSNRLESRLMLRVSATIVGHVCSSDQDPIRAAGT